MTSTIRRDPTPATLQARNLIGALLVAIAAILWACDGLVRYPALGLGTLDPTLIVLVEHILATLLLFPWVFIHHRKKFFSLNWQEWMAAAVSGVGGSALAMIFFTASYLYVNPSIPVLIQKIQPILVVIIAYFILGEKPMKKFYFWATLAFIAVIILIFPDLNFKSLFGSVNIYSKGIQYAFLAAVFWSFSTIAGKILLHRISFVLATFWRFFFGLIGLFMIMLLTHYPIPSSLFSLLPNVWILIYMSLVPGLFSILIYYAGLARTTASTATFVELINPVGAVILNTLFLHTPLSVIQMIASAILILAVTMLSI